MTGNKFLLDTNIIIEVFDGNKLFADKIKDLPQLFIPSIVLGELYIGINRVKQKQKHLNILDNFLHLCTVLVVDSQTAMIYGEIMSELYKKGKPIPTNDVWIAAIAKQYKLIVVSQDKHFNEINDLIVAAW